MQRQSKRLRGHDATPPENILDQCVICLSEPKVLAWLDVCEHLFCFGCIQQWSQNSNTCPLCKRVFHTIVGRRRKLQVQTPPSSPQESEASDSSDWDPDSYVYETYAVSLSDESEPEADYSTESTSSSVARDIAELVDDQ